MGSCCLLLLKMVLEALDLELIVVPKGTDLSGCL